MYRRILFVLVFHNTPALNGAHVCQLMAENNTKWDFDLLQDLFEEREIDIIRVGIKTSACPFPWQVCCLLDLSPNEEDHGSGGMSVWVITLSNMLSSF